jgi:hypothetical protein
MTQLPALEQPGGRTGALLSKNIDRAVKSLYAIFYGVLCTSLKRTAYCAQVYMKSVGGSGF